MYVQNLPVLYRHHAHMCFNMCARGAGTHGDVLSGHTEFRSVSHTNTHTHVTHTTQHITTQHITTTTPHGERQRQRKKTGTERDREDERGETRQEKRRQKKTEERSEKILFSVWWCMAFFFVGVVICLVNPVCARVLSLLNSVKHDSF